MTDEAPEVVEAVPVESFDDGADFPVAAPEALGIELPEDHDEAVEVLLGALATARVAADSYLDDLQRVAAEFENYRKRTQRDREELVERSTQRLVAALLPVLDSFDQAFTHEAKTPSEEQVLAGIRGTFHQLMDVLGSEGLEMIQAEGEPFDPTLHEAVGGVAGDDLVVSQEVRRGYLLKGRVLRPAMVLVAAAEATEDPTPEDREDG
jgi:molecular chaperone GrpE